MFSRNVVLEQTLDVFCPTCANQFTKTLGEWVSKPLHEFDCDCGKKSFTLDVSDLKAACDRLFDVVNRFSESTDLHRKAFSKLSET